MSISIEKMTPEEAIDLASKLNDRYDLKLAVKHFKYDDCDEIDHSYLALWHEGVLVGTLNGPQQFEALCAIAHKIVQIDNNMRQELQQSAKEQDFIERTLAANNLT